MGQRLARAATLITTLTLTRTLTQALALALALTLTPTPPLTRRELPPGVRARLGMYFYIAVALVSLALFVLQLALRFPGYLRFQVNVKG